MNILTSFPLFFSGDKKEVKVCLKITIANSLLNDDNSGNIITILACEKTIKYVRWNSELSQLRGNVYLYYIWCALSPLPQVLQQFPQAPHLPGQTFFPVKNFIISASSEVKMSKRIDDNHYISCRHNQTSSPSNWRLLSAWKIIFSVFSNFLPTFSPELPLLSCRVKVAGICYKLKK